MRKMKVTEIQSHSVSHRVSVPFPTTWSDDNIVAVATEKGLQIMNETKASAQRVNVGHKTKPVNTLRAITMTSSLYYSLLFFTLVNISCVMGIDMTYNVFASLTDGMPAAFGDFDSDKFTDLFVLRNKGRTIEILLGGDTEPLLRQSGNNLTCTFSDDKRITSVVPGDFDGDAFMDVLVTVGSKNPDSEYPYLNHVYILWGNGVKLNCNISEPLFVMNGQPLAMDYDQDMVIDLFGLKVDERRDGDKGRVERGFWVFNHNRTVQQFRPMDTKNLHLDSLKVPHSHAFLDLNSDSYGDLYLTTKNGSAEIWFYNKFERDFKFSHVIDPPPGVDIKKGHYIGQTIFQDMALEGKIDILIPVCFDNECKNSTIYLRSNDRWHNIKIQFNDWHLVHPLGSDGGLYRDTLTLRPGDYNMDGFPDLLATLVYEKKFRTFLLENVECDQINNCDGFPRTFKVRSDAIPTSANENTVLGVFYDFLQDGILDIIFVHDVNNKQTVSAFRNSLDYDANFVKVMVLTGVMNDKVIPAVFHTPLTKKQRIYGTNLPGPTILYHTTTQEGNPRSAISTQLPQSAHFSLNLPYTIFGLGRTPNFVDELIVGVYGHERVWTQLIPNSQMVVIPRPPDGPAQWKVQLFVTPSKLILQSVFALLGTCALISLIIGALYWKERKQDHKEKLQEAQRFHFDAM